MSASYCDYKKNELSWKTPDGENILVLNHKTFEIISKNDALLNENVVQSVRYYSPKAATELQKVLNEIEMNKNRVERIDSEKYYCLATYQNGNILKEERFDIETNKPYWDEKLSTVTLNAFTNGKKTTTQRIWKDSEGNNLVSCDEKSVAFLTTKQLSPELVSSVKNWYFGDIDVLRKKFEEHNKQFMEKKNILAENYGHSEETTVNGHILRKERFDKEGKPFFDKFFASSFRKEGDSRIFEWKNKEGKSLCIAVDGIVEFKTSDPNELTEELFQSVLSNIGSTATKAIESIKTKMTQNDPKNKPEYKGITKTVALDGFTTIYSIAKENLNLNFGILKFLDDWKIDKKNVSVKFYDNSALHWDSKGNRYSIDFTKIYKIEDGVAYLQDGVQWEHVKYKEFVPYNNHGVKSFITKTDFGYNVKYEHSRKSFEENLTTSKNWYFGEDRFSLKITTETNVCYSWLKDSSVILADLENGVLEIHNSASKEDKEIIEKCALKYGWVPPKQEILVEEIKKTPSTVLNSVGTRIAVRKLTKIIQSALISQLTKSISNKKVRTETEESIQNFFKSEMGKGFLGLAIGSVISMLSEVDALKGKKDLITSLSDELQVEGMSVLGEESLDFIVENTLPLFTSFFKETEVEETTKVRVVNDEGFIINNNININFQHEIEQGLKVINATNRLNE